MVDGISNFQIEAFRNINDDGMIILWGLFSQTI